MKKHIIKGLVVISLLLGAITIQAQQKELSIDPTDTSWYPSEYGANDEIGAANLITPELVLKSLKLVKKGKTLGLAVPVDKHLPAYRHRSFHLNNFQLVKSIGPNKFTFNDEVVTAWTVVGTQLNGIGHIGIDNVYYNGNIPFSPINIDLQETTL